MPSAIEKKTKNRRKNGKKAKFKRGALGKSVLEVVKTLANLDQPITTNSIIENLQLNGITATRSQVYLIVHRKVGKGIKVIKSGKGKGTETVFGLE